MPYDPDDPASFSICSKDPATKQRQREYWNKRARGYNLTTLLSLHETEKYDHLISSLVPTGRMAKICDIGTACGFIAVIAARMGHQVTAIDNAPNMVKCARANAKKFNLSIDVREMDAEYPDFPDDQFDLIVANSTIWCLSEPVAAMKRWMNFLKPGGHILICDGNHYLSNYDKDYAEKQHLRALQDTENKGLHGKTNMDRIDFNEIRSIAMDLPVSAVRRPGWDVSVLMGLGFDNIYVNLNEKNPYKTISSSGYMVIPGNFIVTARKPPVESDPLTYYEPERNSELVRSREEFETQASVFKALSDVNRLMILQFLLVNRMNVKQLAEKTGLSPALVSHNLKLLDAAGLVNSSKNGKEVFYMIRDRTKLEEMLYYSSIGGH